MTFLNLTGEEAPGPPLTRFISTTVMQSLQTAAVSRWTCGRLTERLRSSRLATRSMQGMFRGTKLISSPSHIVRPETRFSPSPSSTAASSYEFCSGYAIHSLPNKSNGFEPMWHSSPGFCLRNPPIWIRAGSSVSTDQPSHHGSRFQLL